VKKPNRFAPIPIPDLTGPDHAGFAAGFWANVDQSGGPDACWPWTGRRHDRRTRPGRRFDYGYAELAGRRVYAHRLAHALAKGEVRRGAQVNHSCDTPSCQNPRHLHLGDHGSNMREMVLRDRHARIRYTSSEVDDMRRRRAAGETHPAISARYGAIPTAVARLTSGRATRQFQAVRPPVQVRRPIAERLSIEYALALVNIGFSFKEVAAMFGVRGDSLRYTLREARSLGVGRRTSLSPTPAMSARVAALVGDLAPTAPLLWVPGGLSSDGLFGRVFADEIEGYDGPELQIEMA